MIPDNERELQAYLLEPEPQAIAAARAQALLEHAAECAACAEALAAHPTHAERLLAATTEGAIDEGIVEVLAREEALMRAAVEEFLRGVPAATLEKLREGEAPGTRRGGTDRAADRVEVLRAAMAVSEVALALRSALEKAPSVAVQRSTGNVLVNARTLPASYFVARIADAARIDDEGARVLWAKAIELLAGEGVGVPGFDVARRGADLLVVTRTNEVVRSPETVRPRERAPAARRSAAGAKRRQGTVPIERVLKGAAKKYDVDVITNASLALSRPAAKTVERTADKLFGVIEAAPGRQQVKVGLKRDALVFDVSRLAKEDAGRAVRALTQSKAPLVATQRRGGMSLALKLLDLDVKKKRL